ncbi:BapA/Bap/LapF family prefix-like domain-containing protein [Pseudogulbenkiania subflava]|uniref:Biofilm-associated protein BapA-like prefix-like domain-containing protein n=1 Tax=Pseudogulbenkiania subflava DSM 22618 TaxID=1123014 RepID=A0A1Y6CB40_9NEIS|nr:hypothetical protein [Pseudogulbenkiania subflava]SMF52964.1 hypothetical protein SAMN02745746_03781 [Pseudogulbenkiania subflava DSM 22618]
MIVIVDKQTQKESTLFCATVTVESPSIIKVDITLAQIRLLRRDDNTLFIESDGRSVMTIHGFFTEVDGIKSELVLGRGGDEARGAAEY